MGPSVEYPLYVTKLPTSDILFNKCEPGTQALKGSKQQRESSRRKKGGREGGMEGESSQLSSVQKQPSGPSLNELEQQFIVVVWLAGWLPWKPLSTPTQLTPLPWFGVDSNATTTTLPSVAHLVNISVKMETFCDYLIKEKSVPYTQDFLSCAILFCFSFIQYYSLPCSKIPFVNFVV